jgi:hypothetical protein
VNRPAAGSCGKLLFSSKSAAKRSAKRGDKKGRTYHAYLCRRCGWWHLTTQAYSVTRRHDERGR